MKLVRLVVAALAAGTIFMPAASLASVPGLQITPLQYEDTLGSSIKSGHIDVANPTDSPVHVQSTVRGFRQTGTNGDLKFFDDSDLAAAIKVDLTSFDLQPHAAVRVSFSVDPAKLPAGGTYATVFFQTQPTDNNSGSSYVAQSANVGTLLILRNGAAVAPSGGVSGLSVPFWQFGSGLHGSATVHNTASPHGGVAFRPALAARVLPWGRQTSLTSGLVLPGSSRHFAVSRSGSFFGLIPVTVADSATHTSRTAWVFACTGWSGWILLLLVIILLIFGLRRRFFPARILSKITTLVTPK